MPFCSFLFLLSHFFCFLPLQPHDCSHKQQSTDLLCSLVSPVLHLRAVPATPLHELPLQFDLLSIIKSMAKRQRDENMGLKRDSREFWNAAMDEALIDAFLHQQNMGNRVDGTFTTVAYDNIVAELNTKLNKNLKKDSVKNRWKALKANFSKCYDIFKGGLSGFSWNSHTKMWDAELEVWMKLIEAHPEAEKWMNKSIPHYEKMMILYGKDRATGEHAETPREMRRRQSSNNVEDFMCTIDGIDHMVSENEVNLQNFDSLYNNSMEFQDQQEVQSEPGNGASSSKTKKGKPSKAEKEIFAIVDAIDGVAKAIREGNEYFKDAFQRLPMKESDVYAHLMELDFAGEYLKKAYFFLVKHPEELGAALGTPLEHRKEFIMDLVFGPSTPLL